MEWFVKHYLQDNLNVKDPLASPMEGELKGLPHAIVIAAEYDPLRDQDLESAKTLEQSGVKMLLLDYPGMVHGFVQLPGFFAEGKEAIEKIAFEIKKLYAQNPA